MCFVLNISTKTGSVLGVSKGENRDQRRGRADARNVGQGSVTGWSQDKRRHISLGFPMDRMVTGK